jgi:hypothetical protein
MQKRNEPRPAGHGSVRPISESLIGSVAPGPANPHTEYLAPPAHETFDRARFALQVATAGDRTPVEAWLSLTDADRAALREARAWHESELARLRREHPATVEAMPPLAERGTRWRLACSNLSPDEQSAALAIDEHQRAVGQLAATERAVAPVIRRRRELLRAYRVAVARRFRRRLSIAPRRPVRTRPRGRARRFARSPRRTRGPDDDADGHFLAGRRARERRRSCRRSAR